MAIMLPIVVTAVLAGSGPKMRPSRQQLGVEPLVDDSRLHADRFRIDADDSPHVLGEVDHQPRTQRFARHAAAGAPGVQRNALFRRILHAGGDIGRRSRPDHAQRPNFIDASVAGEELAEKVVAPHVARNQPAEVFLNSLALVIEFVHLKQKKSVIADLRKLRSSIRRASMNPCGSDLSWLM